MSKTKPTIWATNKNSAAYLIKTAVAFSSAAFFLSLRTFFLRFPSAVSDELRVEIDVLPGFQSLQSIGLFLGSLDDAGNRSSQDVVSVLNTFLSETDAFSRKREVGGYYSLVEKPAYEIKIITSVESIVPSGLGRSRIIDAQESRDFSQFASERSEENNGFII